MNILVSGGDGFIGKNLVKFLQKEGHKIIVVDNHITSFLNNNNLDNVIHIEKSIELLDIDKIEKIDVIFHMASVASPLVYKNDFLNVYNPNVKGTEKMIELADRDSARLIFTSTSEVYGMQGLVKNDDKGITENDMSISHLLTDRSVYSISKKMGEELVNYYIKKGGDAIILRLFNVYGPQMDVKNNGYGRVIPNFIEAIRNDHKLKIFGDGKQVRSFIWINDLIDALEILLNLENPPKIMNIGNSEPISINDLASMIFEVTNKNTGIKYSKRDLDDPLWRNPNIDMVKTSLNWRPRTSLKQGLTQIIKVSNND